jgi:predicted transcriptional regulator
MEAKQILVERLRERQAGRTQNEYAEFLGISRAMLSRLYSQDRQIGVDTLTHVCERFPDLAYLFLSESVSTDHRNTQTGEISQSESPQAHPDAL